EQVAEFVPGVAAKLRAVLCGVQSGGRNVVAEDESDVAVVGVVVIDLFGQPVVRALAAERAAVAADVDGRELAVGRLLGGEGDAGAGELLLEGGERRGLYIGLVTLQAGGRLERRHVDVGDM